MPSRPWANQQTGSTLKVMSHNVLFSNQTPDGLVQNIKAAAPDIVGLQELNMPLMAALASGLEEAYPYHTFDYFPQQGVGLLSRYPILSVTRFDFPPRDHLALHAVIDWDDRPVHLFVVHLSANNFFDHPLSQLPALASERYGQRADQVTRLLAEVTRVDGPVIVMCDCNFTDTSAAYGRMRKSLTDSYQAAGWGLGHTLHPEGLPFPVQRIDYVWHNEDFDSLNSFVGAKGGSDHHPVISRLVYGAGD